MACVEVEHWATVMVEHHGFGAFHPKHCVAGVVAANVAVANVAAVNGAVAANVAAAANVVAASGE